VAHDAQSVAQIVLVYALILSIEVVLETIVLAGVLMLLRRPMDLMFPERPAFLGRVVLMSCAMAALSFVPFVGGLLGLAAVAILSSKFFDGTVLAGAYVALATYAAHFVVWYVAMAALGR